jgi:hypothetical protein
MCGEAGNQGICLQAGKSFVSLPVESPSHLAAKNPSPNGVDLWTRPKTIVSWCTSVSIPGTAAIRPVKSDWLRRARATLKPNVSGAHCTILHVNVSFATLGLPAEAIDAVFIDSALETGYPWKRVQAAQVSPASEFT